MLRPVTLRYVMRVNARWRQEIFPEIATYRPQIIQWLRPDRLQGKALAEAVGALAERPAWKAANRAAPDIVIRPFPLAHGTFRHSCRSGAGGLILAQSANVATPP